MDAILSRLSQLEEQARLQAATIASLRSENKALSSAVARLSAQSEPKDAFIVKWRLDCFLQGSGSGKKPTTELLKVAGRGPGRK